MKEPKPYDCPRCGHPTAYRVCKDYSEPVCQRCDWVGMPVST